MHLGNLNSSLIRIALQKTQGNKKICTDNYSRTGVYFERFSVVLRHFLKVPCVEHLLVTKATFLRKWASTLALGIFSIPETNKIKNNTVFIQYVSINFDWKFTKKGRNSLFLRDQTQRKRNILKASHVCINGGFKLLVILLFIIADDLKRELLMNYYGGSYKDL